MIRSHSRDRLAPGRPPRGWRLDQAAGGTMSIPRRPFLPHSNVGQSSRGRLNGPILAVGRRGLGTCSSEGARRGTLTDSTGRTALATLAGGGGVEVLAWEPRGPGGGGYRVPPPPGAGPGWVSAADP